MANEETRPAPASLRVEDVQQAFAWIRAEMVKHGCADDDQEAGALDAPLVDVEIDIISYLTDRARITPTA